MTDLRELLKAMVEATVIAIAGTAALTVVAIVARCAWRLVLLV